MKWPTNILRQQLPCIIRIGVIFLVRFEESKWDEQGRSSQLFEWNLFVGCEGRPLWKLGSKLWSL